MDGIIPAVDIVFLNVAILDYFTTGFISELI